MNTLSGDRINDHRLHTQDALESLSAYMDGELPVEYRDGLLADVKADGALRAEWGVYHCIGDVLRSDDMGCHATGFQRGFAQRLSVEPYLFAPEVAKMFAAQHTVGRRSWRMPASIAAGVAAVVVTGAAVMSPLRGGEGGQSAGQTGAPAVAENRIIELSPKAAPAPSSTSLASGLAVGPNAAAGAGAEAGGAVSQSVSNEYLTAHRYYSNGLAMQGVVSHVRTAGYDGK
jgi:sigma-E factor negative regulatory protein RseA